MIETIIILLGITFIPQKIDVIPTYFNNNNDRLVVEYDLDTSRPTGDGISPVGRLR